METRSPALRAGIVRNRSSNVADVIASTIGKVPIARVENGFRDLRRLQSTVTHLDTVRIVFHPEPALRQMTSVIRRLHSKCPASSTSCILCRKRHVPQPEQIVYRVSEVLLAAEVAFGRLNGSMAEQELNLLDLATAGMAEFRAGPAQIVWSNVL